MDDNRTPHARFYEPHALELLTVERHDSVTYDDLGYFMLNNGDPNAVDLSIEVHDSCTDEDGYADPEEVDYYLTTALPRLARDLDVLMVYAELIGIA